ncbi:D-alanyl-D-alanine carboxypeptidase [Candidatus Woesebacteria bacterium]|nr:D-alanyl-D-alanine carboxypeptidase [Candidatus Woesebacteria bacterium]HNV44846.1 serine hydrolase [Candidatus Woesebacteria bacterium]HOA12061.1 serine hydrolase [Candidatus Woesebacteria bacterium]HOC07528.1 serine hydrolase [Candidatus Woesebacteria bacterium]HOP38968.1 serine hydrolase [Candidatus Woesebacteria bacterium]
MKNLSWRVILLFLIAFSLVLSVVLIFYPEKTIEKQAIYLRPLDLVAVYKNPNINQEHFWENLQLSAESVYAFDLGTATLLYEKNSRKRLYPASTIKMLTALVAVDYYQLDDLLRVDTEDQIIGNKINLQAGEQVRVRDLLAALLLSSANDSAYVLANNYPGGLTNFVAAMNNKAKELHLTDSQFFNPAGLDEIGQLSSARDLNILARELLKNDYLRELVATPYLEINSLTEDGQKEGTSYQLFNTNQLLGTVGGVKGVKTGTTDWAGEVLVTLVERNGRKILISLMNSQDRYGDTEKLLTWIFNTYQFVSPEESLININF